MTWQTVGGTGGSGTAGKIPKWTAATTLGDSLLSDDGTNITLASGQLIFSNQTLTTTVAPAISITRTWNDSGTSHRGVKLAVTETADAATSRYFEILGGASGTTDEFYVLKGGAGYFLGSLQTGSSVQSGTTITAGTHIIATADVRSGASGAFEFAGRSAWRSPIDGVFTMYNNANTDFSRLQFGGTTSSFPSIKRSSAGLVVRLADDSADTTITASSLIATASSSPASGAACTAGTFAWDASYIYVCTASGAWKRAALTGGY